MERKQSQFKGLTLFFYAPLFALHLNDGFRSVQGLENSKIFDLCQHFTQCWVYPPMFPNNVGRNITLKTFSKNE
jgi:hypothetical protein